MSGNTKYSSISLHLVTSIMEDKLALVDDESLLTVVLFSSSSGCNN